MGGSRLRWRGGVLDLEGDLVSDVRCCLRGGVRDAERITGGGER